ncbi:hypothetical protein D3C71_1999860 [compost metagenome]
MHGHHQLGVMCNFPGEQQLLLIASGQLLYRCIELRRLHIEFTHQMLRPNPVLGRLQEA